jgi:hypothetical protein
LSLPCLALVFSLHQPTKSRRISPESPNTHSYPTHIFQTGQLKLENLDYSEFIGIFDALFSCLISWLEGHSPAQTIFICLYLHDTAAIKDKVLMSFCNGILKLTGIIKKFIFK